MKIKIKKEYDDIFEAMMDIGDKIFKDGEVDIDPLLEDSTEIEFGLDNEVEFEVIIKEKKKERK